jgi:uncharacterized protein involved in exopolysaccharide biosynthesis
MKRQLTTGLGNNSFSVRDGQALISPPGPGSVHFLAVLAGAIAVTVLLPNRYSARMKILVKNQRVDLAITPEATSGGAAPTIENEVSENQINSEIELLTSNDLLTQVVNETGLARADSGGWFGKPAPEAARVEKAVTALSKDLTITPVRKANIITVSYSSGSPQMAAAVLKKLGDFIWKSI